MSELSEFREGKDRYFGQDPDAPLTPERQGRFSGLAYYPENSTLQFALTIEMATSTGDSQPYVRWGMISFHVDGEAATLTVYRDKDDGEFFLPFTDLTSGQSSYGEERYVDVQPLHHGRF